MPNNKEKTKRRKLDPTKRKQKLTGLRNKKKNRMNKMNKSESKPDKH